MITKDSLCLKETKIDVEELLKTPVKSSNARTETKNNLCLMETKIDVEELLKTPVKSDYAKAELKYNLCLSETKIDVEELLKTPVEPRAAPRHSFCHDEIYPLNDTKQKLESEIKSKIDESDRARISVTYAEISTELFYGTSTVNEKKIKPSKCFPIPIKISTTMPKTRPKCRHQKRGSMPRQPILGSIRTNKLKTKNAKLTKRQMLFKLTKKAVSDASLKMHFKDLKSNKFDKQLFSGDAEHSLKESGKPKIESSVSVVPCELETRIRTDDAIRELFKTNSRRMQSSCQSTTSQSATVKRGHGNTLLSSPRKKVKKLNDDELQLVRNKAFVEPLSNNRDDELNSSNDDSIVVQFVSDSLRIKELSEISEKVSLYDKYHNMIPCNTTDPKEIERQQTILELLIKSGMCNDENFQICISEYEQHKDKAAQIINNVFELSVVSLDLAEENNMLALTSKNDSVTNDIQDTCKKRRTATLPNKLFEWISAIDQHDEIDKGYNLIGTKTCSQCEMIYLPNDPEEVTSHQYFHNNMLCVMSFNGWKHENLVENVDEWGNMGRIIYVNNAMDAESHVGRIKELMKIINMDLGHVNENLPFDSVIYLAISRKLIIGVCVAEHLKQAQAQAHPFYSEYQVKCINSKTYLPLKCGISRIWVTPQFRRYGVATRLIQAVCSHFVRGYNLSVNEIAFSTQTIIGKKFVQKITANANVA